MSHSRKIPFRKTPGLPPGSFVYTGKQRNEQGVLTLTYYNESEYQEATGQEHFPSGIPPENGTVFWYDLKGLHDVALVERLGKVFSMHLLSIEDLLETDQRPKFEEFEEGLFMIARAVHFDPTTISIHTEQIGLYITANALVSFQEYESDFFTPVRERLRIAWGRIRQRKADYLAYALVDTIVDHYFLVLDQIENVIDQLEENILTEVNKSTKANIHRLKREMHVFRRAVTPLREAINRYARSEHVLIASSSQPFIQDLYDHIIQVMDSIETHRDTLNGLQDLYLSELSFRMNNVMQVLTIISTIFIPLTFLAGIYGMNFKFMPELEYRYGYFVLWGVMVSLFFTGIWFFKKRGWL